METLSLVAIAAIVLATAYAFARKALLSLTYGIAILFVFVLDLVSWNLAFSAPGFGLPIVFDLALVPDLGLATRPWTWVTFQFVHGSIDHLLLNLLGFVLLSPVFEDRVGSPRWAVLFFAGGAVGATLFLALHPERSVILLGASAGLMAVLGAFGRLYPRDRIALFLPIPGMPSLPVLHVVIGFLVLEMALSLSRAAFPGSTIAWEAHVGGILFGFLAAPFVMRIPSRRGRVTPLEPLDALRDLATTPQLKSILSEAEAADLKEIRRAWIEKFVRACPCPQCGGPLRLRLGRLTSACGWRRKID